MSAFLYVICLARSRGYPPLCPCGFQTASDLPMWCCPLENQGVSSALIAKPSKLMEWCHSFLDGSYLRYQEIHSRLDSKLGVPVPRIHSGLPINASTAMPLVLHWVMKLW